MFTLPSLPSLLDTASRLPSFDDLYIRSYPFLLEHFAGIDVLEWRDVVIGIHMVYGWMPTVLKSVDDLKRQEILALLSFVHTGGVMTKNELLFLKRSFNNSLVGVSKLLHFINPRVYAIWDSRVFSFLFPDIRAHKYRVEDPDLYLCYLDWIDHVTQDEVYLQIESVMQVKIGYRVSSSRLIEMICFYGSKI